MRTLVKLCLKIMRSLSGKVAIAISESDDLRDTVRREPETCFLADEAKPTRSSIFQFTRQQQALVAEERSLGIEKSSH